MNAPTASAQGVVLEVLADRLAIFRALSPNDQAAADARRSLPTEHTHSLLAFFSAHGHFADEAPTGRWLRAA